MKKMLYSTMLAMALMSAYSFAGDSMRSTGHKAGAWLGGNSSTYTPTTSRTEHESKSAREKLEDLHSSVQGLGQLVAARGEHISATEYNMLKMAYESVKRVQRSLQEQVDPSNRKSGEADKSRYNPGDTNAQKAAVKMENMQNITTQAVSKAPSTLNSRTNDFVFKAQDKVQKLINELKRKSGSV